ncbi:MAG: S8 family serine peptidase, partial [Lachnoclostridium sp.]|nr:S8 family serine peptidase [Lachnoclostridium sp.]
GTSTIESYISSVTRRIGIACVAAAGNESNQKHHSEGSISKTGDTELLSISVGDNVPALTVCIWYDAIDKISVEVITPLEETTGRVNIRYDTVFADRFTLEESEASIMYFADSQNAVIISIKNPTNGIWNIKLNGDSVLNGKYNAWMPVTGVSHPEVEFLKPSPNYTITAPATAEQVICCGAYNSAESSLYISSSWGPTTEAKVAPDFVAPGVNVNGVYPTGYGTMSGTSVAAAITAGACALLLQWGIVNGNEPAINQNRLQALLINGSSREKEVTYPSNQWGYGKLNLFKVFDFLKES